MLSVNMGPMPHAAALTGMPPQLFGGPKPNGAGIFAPPTNEGHHTPMPGVQSYGLESYGFGLPPGPQMRGGAPAPAQVFYIVTVVPAGAVTKGDFSYTPDPAPVSTEVSIPRRTSSPIRAPGTGIELPPVSAPAAAQKVSLPSDTSFRFAPAVFDAIPSAAQIVMRNVDSAALVKASATDGVFNAYAPQLLLATSNASELEQSWRLSSTEYNSAGDEQVSDFITLSDVLGHDGFAASAQAVEREQQAVDAALSEIHSFDPLTVDTAVANDDLSDANAAANSASGDAKVAVASDPSSLAEGGMVMLEATGDATQDAMNLATQEADGGGLIRVPVGVEAAVGFYQAMDVATEESMAAPLPAAEPAGRGAANERISTDGVKDSSGESAAAITATTFVGALLWANRQRRVSSAAGAEMADEDDSRE
jgi:hypothetical protein